MKRQLCVGAILITLAAALGFWSAALDRRNDDRSYVSNKRPQPLGIACVLGKHRLGIDALIGPKRLQE